MCLVKRYCGYRIDKIEKSIEKYKKNVYDVNFVTRTISILVTRELNERWFLEDQLLIMSFLSFHVSIKPYAMS